ncbi:MAG TPA: DNA glycosylase [Bacillota bacterium]|nr:DNA glycosylase [Bacillota bacterium]HOG53213.1 DNA glycosylase [Bacillota bacterium]
MSNSAVRGIHRGELDGKEGYFLQSLGRCDLAMTLESGQAFRWRRRDGAFEGVISGRQVRLRQAGETAVFVEGSDDSEARFVSHYLALDMDQPSIERELSAIDGIMQKAVASSSGLRTLRQEPWETLIAFIISANNGVPNITRVIESLSSRYGDLIEGPFGTYSAFPRPEQLAGAGHDGIWSCKAGFRTRGICEAARGVLDGTIDLDAIAACSYPEAKKMLLPLHGVGEKVADCILLFSMGKLEAFPVDVWIERIVRLLYFEGARISHRYIRSWAAETYGRNAGPANQFLFNYGRKFAARQLRRDEKAARER